MVPNAGAAEADDDCRFCGGPVSKPSKIDEII
jgi:hypothetical protein